MNLEIYALVNIGIALLLAALSIPLIFRKIPMNHFYGIRFPQSFKSDEAWYEINRFGGIAFLVSSLPVFVSGIYGLFQKHEDYFLIGTIIIVASLGSACLISYLKARNY